MGEGKSRMTNRRAARVLGFGLLMACASWAQPAPAAPPMPVMPPGAMQPDAHNTQRELSDLFRRYPPNLRRVLALDPTLLTNQAYLVPYPALAGFLSTHPEIARSPTFYVGGPDPERPPDSTAEIAHTWENVVSETEATLAGIMAMCLIAWLIRSFIDYRRWGRVTRVQTEAHTKLLDRFSNNEDLLAYVNSPAGSKFLQSTPIALDSGPRSVAAPLGRILWTVQGGVVLVAVGIGLEIVSRQSRYPVQEPLHALGILAVSLGLGFVISAIISFVISQRLGLIERRQAPTG
jgi:hypothetical protein